MQALIPQCWSLEPEHRPTFDQIISRFRDARFRIVPSADGVRIGMYAESIDRWETDDVAQSHSN
jgi:hypothetical protein